MASRIVLMVQYGILLVLLWSYVQHLRIRLVPDLRPRLTYISKREVRPPLIFMVCTLFVAALCYFGISFGFSLRSAPMSFIAWYVIGACELSANIFVACKWTIATFKETCLAERMGCLTLIVVSF